MCLDKWGSLQKFRYLHRVDIRFIKEGTLTFAQLKVLMQVGELV